jgi:Polyketide cyclase / dehydrase and lipid transport
VSVSVTVVAPADPAAAWERWVDFARWPDWNPSCRDARLSGPLAPGSTLALKLVHPRGRDFYTRPRLTVVEPERELAWEARGLGLRAPTRTVFVPEHDGTRLTVEADARGPLAFTYRVTMTDRTQALIYVAMLDALSSSLRG